MILVTVGTNPTMGFDRLIQPVDQLAAELAEPVVIQRGCSSYEPQHAEHFRFTTSEHIEQLSEDARVIVSHAAAGAVIVALRYEKPIVMVPRLHRLGEHIDDHQLELAHALTKQKRVVTVDEPTAASLKEAIEQAAHLAERKQEPSRLVDALRSQLDQWRQPVA